MFGELLNILEKMWRAGLMLYKVWDFPLRLPNCWEFWTRVGAVISQRSVFAQVMAIEPCPPIESGPGRIVVSVFRHYRAPIWRLIVDNDVIEGTELHPFWSLDQQTWVALRHLRTGERLSGENGPVSTRNIEDTGRIEPVFNLEVDADHCYRVGEQGLLVHNVSQATTPDFEYDDTCNLQKANQDVCPASTIATYRKFPNRPLYRPLVDGLPQGVVVYLKAPLPMGEKPQVDPPGYDSTINKPGKTVISRGHILAKSLGGNGGELNIFTICQQTTNTPWMTDFENHIRNRINSSRKEEWFYEIALGYTAGNIPSYVKIRACTEERDLMGQLTGKIYRTVQFWWDRGIENQAGLRGISSCKGS